MSAAQIMPLGPMHASLGVAGALLCSLLWIANAAGAEVAERPAWKVGDKWTFHKKTDRPPSESDWTRDVRKVFPDGTYRVETQTGSMLTFDGEGNSLDKRGAAYSWRRLAFPMAIGKHWNHDRKIDNDKDLITGYETSTWHVRAYERITVPAGSYDCYRVEGTAYRSERNEKVIGFSRYQTRIDTTYWYCPEVRGVAKWVVKSDFIFGGAFMPTDTHELKSFEHR